MRPPTPPPPLPASAALVTSASLRGAVARAQPAGALPEAFEEGRGRGGWASRRRTCKSNRSESKRPESNPSQRFDTSTAQNKRVTLCACSSTQHCYIEDHPQAAERFAPHAQHKSPSMDPSVATGHYPTTSIARHAKLAPPSPNTSLLLVAGKAQYKPPLLLVRHNKNHQSCW